MKMKYTDLHLKTKRTLSSAFFKTHNITFENIGEEKLISLNSILSNNPSNDRRVALYEMLISETSLEADLLRRFERFVKTTIHTEEFYRLKFGDEEGIKRFKNAVSSRGKGNTLQGQIAKYGLQEGTRRHTQMNSKRAHTIENFIRKHGEEKGRKMFDHTMSKKGVSLDVFKNKYGEELGLERYNEWKEKCVSTQVNFIKRYGEELGKKKWKEFKEKSISTKENFIRRHGEKLGTEKYELFCKRSANTKENFIRVHGIEEGSKRWLNYKNSNAGYFASQASLDFFRPITDALLDRGMEITDLWFGGDESFEYKIESNEKLYSYDYTISPLKLIFEFNGHHVHPSKELLGEKWNEWRCAWTGETADEKHSADMEKISIAEKEGFTVIEIWDYEDKNTAFEKCMNLINQRI